MELYHDIDLQDCPLCHGPGLIEEEEGWCLYVACLDCGCRTAELPFSSPEERLAAAKQVASLWNMGKVIHSGAVGDACPEAPPSGPPVPPQSQRSRPGRGGIFVTIRSFRTASHRRRTAWRRLR